MLLSAAYSSCASRRLAREWRVRNLFSDKRAAAPAGILVLWRSIHRSPLRCPACLIGVGTVSVGTAMGHQTHREQRSLDSEDRIRREIRIPIKEERRCQAFKTWGGDLNVQMGWAVYMTVQDAHHLADRAVARDGVGHGSAMLMT